MQHSTISDKKPSYFVMNKSNGGWIRVSKDFEDKEAAEQELNRLRTTYPFARVGGTRSY